MSRTQTFCLAALGGLLPIIVSMVTVDLAPIIDNMHKLTPGIYLGYCIRVAGLLILGGTMAVLNGEVKQPLSIVQLGIAAPALVTSFINGASLPANQTHRLSFSIVSAANAQPSVLPYLLRDRNFFGDVVTGLGTRMDVAVARQEAKPQREKQVNLLGTNYWLFPSTTVSGPITSAVCQTSEGSFGPAVSDIAVGSHCVVMTSEDQILLGKVAK